MNSRQERPGVVLGTVTEAIARRAVPRQSVEPASLDFPLQPAFQPARRRITLSGTENTIDHEGTFHKQTRI